MLIRSEIPLFKLQNSAFKDFTEIYSEYKLAGESTLRKNYTGYIYEQDVLKIQHIIKGGPLWIVIDEITDVDILPMLS